MQEKIMLPTVQSVLEFVRASSAAEESILVTNERKGVSIDGTSLLGMMNVVGFQLKVHYNNNSSIFTRVLERYHCE